MRLSTTFIFSALATLILPVVGAAHYPRSKTLTTKHGSLKAPPPQAVVERQHHVKRDLIDLCISVDAGVLATIIGLLDPLAAKVLLIHTQAQQSIRVGLEHFSRFRHRYSLGPAPRWTKQPSGSPPASGTSLRSMRTDAPFADESIESDKIVAWGATVHLPTTFPPHLCRRASVCLRMRFAVYSYWKGLRLSSTSDGVQWEMR
ncbi:hypothetical protein H0H81_005047 [Sphagnurus paluster]|uniref:Uncharacterized protein n=1 Tax=Sphagnurus paluster TaxID=117069 RepID=A0A9P7K5P1_9AGAR|nr:hypothetical protein H0H81_005047 [Sphagnurus paluster]